MSVLGILDAMRSSYQPAVRLVWACLENHANGHRFWAMTDEDIGQELHLATKTVQRAVATLEADGIIRVNRCKRRKTVFWMVRNYPAKGTNGTQHEPELTSQDVHSSADSASELTPPECPVNSQLTSQDVHSSAELTGQNVHTVYPPVLPTKEVPTQSARARASRRVRLPPEWRPRSQEVAIGIDLGLSRATVEQEAEAMRDWAAAEGKTCMDWDARFRNWLRRARQMPAKRQTRAGQMRDMIRDWNLPTFGVSFDEFDEPPTRRLLS